MGNGCLYYANLTNYVVPTAASTEVVSLDVYPDSNSGYAKIDTTCVIGFYQFASLPGGTFQVEYILYKNSIELIRVGVYSEIKSFSDLTENFAETPKITWIDDNLVVGLNKYTAVVNIVTKGISGTVISVRNMNVIVFKK